MRGPFDGVRGVILECTCFGFARIGSPCLWVPMMRVKLHWRQILGPAFMETRIEVDNLPDEKHLQKTLHNGDGTG